MSPLLLSPSYDPLLFNTNYDNDISTAVQCVNHQFTLTLSIIYPHLTSDKFVAKENNYTKK